MLIGQTQNTIHKSSPCANESLVTFNIVTFDTRHIKKALERQMGNVIGDKWLSATSRCKCRRTTSHWSAQWQCSHASAKQGTWVSLSMQTILVVRSVGRFCKQRFPQIDWPTRKVLVHHQMQLLLILHRLHTEAQVVTATISLIIERWHKLGDLWILGCG